VPVNKIARFWPAAQRTGAAAAATTAAEPDGLDAFGSEHAPPLPPPTRRVLALVPQPALAWIRRADGRTLLKWAAVVLVAGSAGAATLAYLHRTASPAPVSQLTVETRPAGLEVSVDGKSRGRTPVTMDLPPGTYAVQVGSGAQQRVLTATLVAGGTLVERVEMPSPTVTGSLRVETEPSGLAVFVDGVRKGRSPVTVADLTPGGHQVSVAGAAGGVRRRNVSVRANETVSLILSAAGTPPAAGAGWLSVSSPVRVQLREDGGLIGSTDMDRVMLPAGDHTLAFVNEELGYRVERRVSITAGRTASVTLQPPEGILSINAQPWAEVWLDGRPLGQTPIGNVATPIGSHEVLFRHPDLGERRARISVGLKQPARIGVDMRKQ
jgi:hypothetical protein